MNGTDQGTVPHLGSLFVRGKGLVTYRNRPRHVVERVTLNRGNILTSKILGRYQKMVVRIINLRLTSTLL